jgi:hypothetical protein
MSVVWTHDGYEADRPRLNRNQQRVLEALRAAGARGMTNVELCTPTLGGLRSGARLGELKRMGLVGEPVREQGGVWRWYAIQPEPQPQAGKLF